LRRADHSSKESYRLCKKDYETEEEARAQQKSVDSLMNECSEGEAEEFRELLLHSTFFFSNSTQNMPVLSGERPTSNCIICPGIIVG
jgi:hypothetical protein